MSLLTLPEPANWPDGRSRSTRASLAMTVLILAGVLGGAHSVVRGDYFTATVLFGLAVPFVLTLAMLHFVSRGKTALRASHGPSGTVLRTDRTFNATILVVLGLFVPLGAFVVVFTLTGDLRMFSGERARLAAMVVMGLAAVTALTGLLMAWRRGGVGYVKLTPTGVEVADIKSTEFVAWDDIDDVDDHSDVNKKTRKAVVLRRRDGSEKVIDGCDFYVPNGVGLYWMVRHYWRHPSDRSELTDDRSLARLDEGRFDTDLA